MSRYAEAHKLENLGGPGDARPTAEQVIEDENATNLFAGKTILITGGGSGLGAESARVLYQTGAQVYIAARRKAKAEEVAKAISTDPSKPPVKIIVLDLSSLDSVGAGAQQFLSQSKTLNIPLANAGIMAPPESRTKDGYEEQYGVNHLAHFVLLQALKDILLASSTPFRASLKSSTPFLFLSSFSRAGPGS